MTIRLCLSLMLLSLYSHRQVPVQFSVLTKTPAFSGYAVGYANVGKYIFLRDWENYYHYSFEANTWSRLEFNKKLIKLEKWAPRAINPYARRQKTVHLPLLSNQLPLSFLPSFSKIIFISERLEVLDTETMDLSYMEVDGGTPISSGVAVRDEKIYVFGGLILAPGPSHGKSYKWETEFSARLIAFDPASLTFQELEAMPIPLLCQGAFVNESLYIFGTHSAEKPQSSVLCYDTQGKGWGDLGKVPIDITSSAIASSGQKIFLLGTQSLTGYLGVYDTATREYAEFPTNVKCTNGVAFVRDNKLYYFGGIDINFPGWIDRNMYVLDLATLPK